MGVKFRPTVPAPEPSLLSDMESRAIPTVPSPEHDPRATKDPRTIPPKRTAKVSEHETAGRVWPERGLPEEYQQTGVRYDENNMVGTGRSAEGKLEESMRHHRYGHDEAESDQEPPRAVAKVPFKFNE